MSTVTTLATTFLGATLPNPNPEQPPGTQGLVTVIDWIAWIALFAGLAGFLASAGYLAFASWSGREMQGVKGLVIAIVVCILVGAAGGIIKVFV